MCPRHSTGLKTTLNCAESVTRIENKDRGISSKIPETLMVFGARGGSRTRTTLQSTDFKSPPRY